MSFMVQAFAGLRMKEVSYGALIRRMSWRIGLGETGPPRKSSMTTRVGRSRPNRYSRGASQEYQVESPRVKGPWSSRVRARIAAMSIAPAA